MYELALSAYGRGLTIFEIIIIVTLLINSFLLYKAYDTGFDSGSFWVKFLVGILVSIVMIFILSIVIHYLGYKNASEELASKREEIVSKTVGEEYIISRKEREIKLYGEVFKYRVRTNNGTIIFEFKEGEPTLLGYYIKGSLDMLEKEIVSEVNKKYSLGYSDEEIGDMKSGIIQQEMGGNILMGGNIFNVDLNGVTYTVSLDEDLKVKTVISEISD